MTTGGWITLVLSVGFFLGLFVWCVAKLLRTDSTPPPPKRDGDKP